MDMSLENRSKHLRPGFSFIELVIVLAIMAVLAVTVSYSFRYIKSSKITKTATTLSTLRTTISSYYASVGKYPTSLTDLIRKPADVPLTKWVERFLDMDEIPQDAWGNDFVYKLTPKAAHPYELYSYGEEGPGSDVEGQISVWKQQ